VFDAAHADFEGLPVVFWGFFAGKTMGKWGFIWTNPAFCSGEMAFNGGLMFFFNVFFWALMGILMDNWLVAEPPMFNR
jgi:hypothetical protein